ncbi:MAG: glycosyl hydrolase [Solirubrobacterales bacterium]
MAKALLPPRPALCLLTLAALAALAAPAPIASAGPHSSAPRVERMAVSMKRKLGAGGQCSALWRSPQRRRSAHLRRRFELRMARCRHARLAHRATSSATKPQLPLYWGAWIGDQLTGEQAPWDMGAVTKFEEMVGKSVSLINFSQPFANCSSSPCSYYRFPAPEMENIRRHGSIPFFSWASDSTPTSVNEPNFQLSDVIEGTYDSYIKQFAEAAREWGHPFFLRFNWEMNGNWFPWSEGANGNQAGEYVSAWRHVHDIFASVGASNVSWVWCPNVDPEGHLQNLSSLYPGNEYVNWTGLDGYNWGTNPISPKGWSSFNQLYSAAYQDITETIAPAKPMVIGEMGSTEDGGSKSAWIQEALSEIPANYPKIRALMWFEKFEGGMDWPIESSASATSAFASGIQNPAYLGNSYSSLGSGPIQPPS